MDEDNEPLFTEEDGHRETVYEDRSCCLCHCAYFPLIPRTLCGEWLVRPLKPILLGIFSCCSAFFFWFDTWGKIPDRNVELGLYLGGLFSMVCLVWSYVATIVRGPGYVPFNWNLEKRKHYSWHDTCRYLVVYEEQYQYAKHHSGPPRSFINRGSRRYVLRGDHYCDWVETFIGIKNHRYFMLIPFWMIVYSGLFIGAHYYWGLSLTKESKWYEYIGSVFDLAHVILVGFSMFHLVRALRHLIVDETFVEWKHKIPFMFRKNCWGSFKDVCGPGWCCLFWIFPFCCFEPLEDGFYLDTASDLQKILLVSEPSQA